MTALADYDDLVGVIYDAAAARRTIGEMLCRLSRTIDAVAAGFLVYSEDGEVVTHSLVAPPPVTPFDLAAQLGDMNEEPGPRALSRMSFRHARRFTDVVPRHRLTNAGWFQRQAVVSGMGYGIGIDLDLTGQRVRLFCMRAADSADFESDTLDLLALVARHVERAFATARHRLASNRQTADVAVLVYRKAMADGAMCDGRLLERQLALRYGLTRTEARVALAANGCPREELAKSLSISVNSLKTHLRRIYAKLNVRRSGELVRTIAMLRNSDSS